MVITRSPPMTRQRTLNMRFGEAQHEPRPDTAPQDMPDQQNPISPTHGDPGNLNLDADPSEADRNSDQQVRDQLLRVDMEQLQTNGNEANMGEDDVIGGNLSGQQQHVDGAEQQISNNRFLKKGNMNVRTEGNAPNVEMLRNQDQMWTFNDSLTGLGLGLPPPAQPPLESTPQSEEQRAFFQNRIDLKSAPIVGTASQQQSFGLFSRATNNHGYQPVAPPVGNPNLRFAMAATALQQQNLGPFSHAPTRHRPLIGNPNLNFAASATAYNEQMIYPAPNLYQQTASQSTFNGFPNPPPGFTWNLVPVNANVGQQNIQPVGHGIANNHLSASQQRQQRLWSDDGPGEFRDDERQHGRESAREMHRVHFDDWSNNKFESENRDPGHFSAQAMKSLDSFSYSMTMNTLPNLKGNIGIDAIKSFFKQFDVATEEWPDRKRLSALESKCSGRAERAFNAAVENNPFRYESIKRAMVQQLEETDAKQMGAFDELMAGIRRRTNESIDDLADRVAALVHRAYPGLTQHLYDEYSVKHLIRSLGNPELALSLEFSRREGCSLDEFVALAARAEATQRAARNATCFWPNIPNNANHFAPSNYPGTQNPRPSYGYPTRQEVVCFNCGQPGHLSRYCEVSGRDHRGAVGQNYDINSPNNGANSTPFSSGSNGQQNFGEQNKAQSSRNLRQNFLVEQDIAPPIRDELFAGALTSDQSSELAELFSKSNKNRKGSAKSSHGNGPTIGNLMMVKVSVCGESTNAMLDGGAQISLISAAFFLRLVREGKVDKSAMGIPDSGRRVMDINGKSVDYYGIVSLPISRGSQFTRVQMHVIEAPFGFDLMFGTNAFNQLGFKLFDALNQKVIDFKGVSTEESSPEIAHVIYSVKLPPAMGPCGRAVLIPNLEPRCAAIEEYKKARKKEKRRRQKERRKLRKFENLKGKRKEDERKNGNLEESSRTVTSRLRTIEFSGGGVKAQTPTRPDDRQQVGTVHWKSPFARGKAGLSICDCPCQRADFGLGFRQRFDASPKSGLGLGDRPASDSPIRVQRYPGHVHTERARSRFEHGDERRDDTRLCSPPTFRMPNRVTC